MKLKSETVTTFQKLILTFYEHHGRKFPWRETTNPYHIVISELMLQQTQTDRVMPKYQSFLKRFPTIKHLARAATQDVLSEWQGLGYNRRALFAKHMAEKIVSSYQGKFPDEQLLLEDLPGIGPYTAAAVCAFAFNQPTVFIETNIRTVYIHHFSKNKEKISDKELFPIIKQTVDNKNPRRWYWALMDYGAYLKKAIGNINSKSKHYTKQSKFEGSNRQIRGEILKCLLQEPNQTAEQLTKRLQKDREKIIKILRDLVEEGFIREENDRFLIH
jgi:A/G-specific adenine glycosylase